MTGRYLEDVLRGSLVRFIYRIIFLGCKYLIRLVRTGWVKTGLFSSYLEMSGRNIRQNFNKGTKIHTIEIWNIDSKKYPEILSSEYFGILIPNSN